MFVTASEAWKKKHKLKVCGSNFYHTLCIENVLILFEYGINGQLKVL